MLSFSSFAGFNFEQLHIQPFYLSHDVYTVGYKVQDGENRFVYATDLGAPSPRLIEISAGADEVMLESNYDADMLKNGRYPAYLKRRIQSDLGHLSNTDCADTLVRMAQNGTKCFILGHLSEENNLPALALQASEERLKGGGCTVRVAPQHEPLSTAKQSWEENAADNPATLRREALF
jgi:phosphoribosyl 1,2-cyclic phosphodiesterase